MNQCFEKIFPKNFSVGFKKCNNPVKKYCKLCSTLLSILPLITFQTTALHTFRPRQLLLILLLSGASCSRPAKQRTYVIAFSQCVGGDQWRQTMLSEMRRELSFHDHINFLYRDAAGSSDRQVRQIDTLVSQGIDLLIVSPNEVRPLSAAIEKVYRSGIPVVVVDRRTNHKDYTAFIGAENFEVGQNAGRYAVSMLKGEGKVMEVTGLPDASPVIDRHNGFMDIISHYPGIRFVKKIDGYWTEAGVEDSIRALGNIDLIFAQNDNMGLQMYHVCKDLGLEKKIRIIGVDGLPMKDMGLDMVARHYISATVLYPTGGQEAILTALNILNRKPYYKENQLFTTVIDSSNVRLMKMQAEKLASQQLDIEQRQKVIDKQILITRSQSTVILIIASTLTLALFFSGISWYFLRENKKINRRLAIQNKAISDQNKEISDQNIAISDQKNQLMEMSVKAEQAHQAKLNFFTNISHEFRTPLTLILSPLEDLMRHPRLPVTAAHTLQLVQKNVLRLYRLVNQLMDFRKIEFKKMRVRATENDLVAFVREIVGSYEELARHKHISLQFLSSERQLQAWFDTSMIDKVLFNLLSNAFKFTGEGGAIYVTVSKHPTHAQLQFEDSGIGMSPESIRHAFEPFFQGEYENNQGTGLGLALSKELMELHHGSISVTSEKWKGTTFTITLPLGRQHFSESEVRIDPQDTQNPANPPASSLAISADGRISVPAELSMLTEFSDGDAASQGASTYFPDEKGEKKGSLLIVEDNEELRQYLKGRLSHHYDTMDAGDAGGALELVFDQSPDLVICDVVIPGKSGLDITRILKSDIRTAHIPVILLTARADESQQIEGLKTGADAYVTKPFNMDFLEQTIDSLLNNRKKSKDHYSVDLMPEVKSIPAKKTARKFIQEFSAIVEKNLSNEEFGVEDICTEMKLSRIQLYRKVKSHMDCNVNEYISTIRLQKAKYYLQHENLSIAEIAYKTGFASASYFSTAFKSKFSMTPSEFKANGPR